MINDTPIFLTNDPNPQTHAVMIDTKYSNTKNENIILPLILKGVISYLLVNKPNKK